jgi:hypothetical protein
MLRSRKSAGRRSVIGVPRLRIAAALVALAQDSPIEDVAAAAARYE